jgi:hypothetical protein
MVARLLLFKILRLFNFPLDLHHGKGVADVVEGTVDTVFDRMLKMFVIPSRRNRNALKVSYLYPMKRECKTERR